MESELERSERLLSIAAVFVGFLMSILGLANIIAGAQWYGYGGRDGHGIWLGVPVNMKILIIISHCI